MLGRSSRCTQKSTLFVYEHQMMLCTRTVEKLWQLKIDDGCTYGPKRWALIQGEVPEAFKVWTSLW